MLGAVVLSAAIVALPGQATVEMSPGDGIRLAPNPVTSTPADGTGRAVEPSGAPAHTSPTPLPAVVALGAAAVGVGVMRRRDDPLIVLVHGDGGSPTDFDFIVRQLGIDPGRVVAFDYSAVDGGRSSRVSSRTVPTDQAADSLDAMIRGLSATNSNIYSIHHSRGGAVGVEVIADLDDGTHPPIDGYRGAALLDPAIASGALGALQSVGRFGGPIGERIPDDGGFDPIRCDDHSCRDVRDGLGRNAGVAVVAIRNRDAIVTNFHDDPPGLRVYDLADGKPSALWFSGVPILFHMRVTDAHASVLTSGDVVDCIEAEIGDPGSCRALAPDGPVYVPVGTGGGGGAARAM